MKYLPSLTFAVKAIIVIAADKMFNVSGMLANMVGGVFGKSGG